MLENIGMKKVFTKMDLRWGYNNMRMEVDTSDYATGEVLSIEGEDGKWRPVTFLFKFLNEMERNYKIHNKEMLVIIRGLES